MAELTLIHEAVQERYGAIALQGGSCCGSSDCCGDSSTPNAELLYNADLLDGLPIDVTGLSLGCGDPVTIAALHPGETRHSRRPCAVCWRWPGPASPASCPRQ